MYLIEDKGEKKMYRSLQKVSADYRVSVLTLRQNRRVAHGKGNKWKYLINGVTLIQEVDMVKEKSNRGGKRENKENQ